MDAIKWALVFLCLGSKGIQAETSPWIVTAPSSIKGLPGSCVVIPCTFTYPEPQNPVTRFAGIWMYGNDFIYHPVVPQMLQEYRGRTELLGDPKVKNCSLKIDPLQLSDTGPFHFRVEMEGYDSYSYKENAVSIAMIDEPNPIKFSADKKVVVGRTTTASCTVTHSCPAAPPVFTWNHPGKDEFRSKQLEEGQWEATSLLTFDPARADHHTLLQCNVTYKGGRHQQTSEVLSVQYAPEIKTTSTCSSDKTMVTCTCFAESSPPSTVRFLLSGIDLPNVTAATHGSLTFATVQRHFGSSGFVQCLASNTVGNANLTLSVLVHNEMKSNYTAVAIGVSVAAVIFLGAVVLLIKRRGSPAQQPTLQVVESDKAQRPPQYSTAPRSQRLRRGSPAQQPTLQVVGSDEAQRPPQYSTAPRSQGLRRGSPAQQPTLQVVGSDEAQRPPQYPTAPREEMSEDDDDYEDNDSAIYTNGCIYNTMKAERGGNYDEVYANM